jgi:hypothetical protein
MFFKLFSAGLLIAPPGATLEAAVAFSPLLLL